jgi:hypothetical protein
MAHSHYVLDLYYPGDGNTDLLRREVMRIDAGDDAEAVKEGTRISGWRHPVRFDVRAITNSARKGDRLVYTAATAVEAQHSGAAAGDTIVLSGSI